MSEPQNIKEWLRTLTDQELAEFKHQCAKDGDDETEEMIYREMGQRRVKDLDLPGCGRREKTRK